MTDEARLQVRTSTNMSSGSWVRPQQVGDNPTQVGRHVTDWLVRLPHNGREIAAAGTGRLSANASADCGLGWDSPPSLSVIRLCSTAQREFARMDRTITAEQLSALNPLDQLSSVCSAAV